MPINSLHIKSAANQPSCSTVDLPELKEDETVASSGASEESLVCCCGGVFVKKPLLIKANH